MYETMITENENRIHYCPIGVPQRRFGAYVTGAGREITNPGEPYPHDYHSSDYYFTWEKGRKLADWEYQILYIRSGRGVIEFRRGKTIQISAGTLIMLHPGEWHRYRPDEQTGWDEAYIGIGGDVFRRIVGPPFFTANPTIVSLPPNGWFDNALMELVAEIQSASAERPYTLALKAATLVASVFERIHTYDAADAHNATIRKATLHIGHHLGEFIDFQKLAGDLGIGYSFFRKRFKNYTGLAPLEYQNALRIRRAVHLLTSSDAPIAQIAEDLGFNSPAYFARFFRKATGRSPSAARLRPTASEKNGLVE